MCDPPAGRGADPRHAQPGQRLGSFCLETPVEAAPTPVLSAAEGPPDAGRRSPAHYFPDKNQVGYRVPSSAWGIVVDRSGSINTMLKPLQQSLMAIRLAQEELALPRRIAAFEGNVVRAFWPAGV